MGVLGLTWVGLAVVAGCLLVVSLDSPVGAGRAEESLSDRAGYLRRWSALHGDHDPSGSPLTVWWLDLVRLLATPLAARGVRPGAVTGWGVWAATAVAVACAGHGHWALLGVLAVVAGRQRIPDTVARSTPALFRLEPVLAKREHH